MYTILNFPTVSDKRGSLTYINNIEQIPFEIKRVFMVTDVPEGMTRGGHAHKNLQEVLIPLNGSFCVEVTDGKNCSEICLSSENSGIPSALLPLLMNNSFCLLSPLISPELQT